MEYENVRNIYHAYSGFYDFIFKKTILPRQKYAIDAMNIKPGEKVLDVGVGTGLSISLYPRECRVTGIDLSASMLEKAQRKKEEYKLKHVSLVEMDACNMEFGDDEFDHVVAAFVLTVVPDPVKALLEMKRVCKKGRFLVIINHFMSENKIIAKAEKLTDPLFRKLGWRMSLELGELLKQSGLQTDSRIRMNKKDLWSIVFANNTKP
jgi:phosphatidylethanolamine/phosphatidyl-N-methylethanolamine N-methyltransferase